MPVASYFVYPEEGRESDFLSHFDADPHCTLIPADDEPVYILVTETDSWQEELALQEGLKHNDTLACLVMVYGQIDEDFSAQPPQAVVTEEEGEQRCP